MTVDYIGFFGSGPEVGKVFDTSIKSVATDNATYPKSLEYTPRNSTGYTPLPVHVGPKTPNAGYKNGTLTFGGVVTGFWQGLLGLQVNQSRYVTVPAYKGYGPLNTSCLTTGPLEQTLPTVVVYSPGAFTKAYTGVTAAAGVTFADPTYGWTDTVLSVNSTAVAIERMPYAGETVTPFGWTMLVSNLTSSTLTLQSELTPASAGNVLGNISSTTVCSSTKFVLWGVDLAAGTYTANYNREVVGVTLVFRVTIVAIE